MNRLLNLFRFSLCFLFVQPIFSQAAPFDLQKSFEAAIQYNESVKIKEQDVEIAKEQKSQAVGSVLPQISAIGTYTKQDTSQLTNAQKTSISEDNHSARLNASQSLFKGTREYAAWRAANRNVEAQEFSFQQTKRDLYAQVAQQFYTLLQAKKDLENLKTLLDLTEKRAADLQKRTRVGRARRGELLQAQALSASARALVKQGETALTQAKTSFYQVTGIADGDPIDVVTLPSTFKSLDSYLGQLEERPDLKAYKKRVDYSDELVSTAWGAHLPTLDLDGNYYLRREGSLEKVKWDVGVVLTIPLFEGGVTQSKVREAAAGRLQSELQLAYGRRTAEKEIRDLFSAVSDGVQQLATLKESAKLAEENFREQTKDNRYGLVTSLEVLQALNTYIESRRSLDRVNSQVKTAYAQLRAATGEIN